jgi:hypothetical protein
LALGSAGVLLAFVPHYVGLIGVAAGGFGVAAGTIGVLLRGQRRPAPAVWGIVVSALAVLIAGVMTFGYLDVGDRAVRHRSAADATNNTRAVLGKELGVQIGAFSYTPPPSSPRGFPRAISLDNARLTVTLTNKLAVARRFSITVAGFESQRIQIGAFTVQATLDGRATREVNAAYGRSVSDKTAQRLKKATFAVIAAYSYVPERP